MSKSLIIGNPMSTRAFVSEQLPPTFLVPSLVSLSRAPCLHSQFSTTSAAYHRRRKGDNPDRGVSALRRTGLRFAVGMSKYPLPRPVLDPKKRSKIEVDEKHGLWGFFNKKRTLLTEPLEEAKFGIYLSHKCGDVLKAHRTYQVAPGRIENCETNLGSISILCGGYAARNGTEWRLRRQKGRESKQEQAIQKLKLGTWR